MNAKQKARAEIERRTLEGIAEYQQMMQQEALEAIRARFEACGYVQTYDGTYTKHDGEDWIEVFPPAPSSATATVRECIDGDMVVIADVALTRILAALEHPSEEYATLSLRLANL